MSDSTAVIQVAGLPNVIAKQAVKDVSFAVEKGQILGLIGSNGNLLGCFSCGPFSRAQFEGIDGENLLYNNY